MFFIYYYQKKIQQKNQQIQKYLNQSLMLAKTKITAKSIMLKKFMIAQFIIKNQNKLFAGFLFSDFVKKLS